MNSLMMGMMRPVIEAMFPSNLKTGGIYHALNVWLLASMNFLVFCKN